MDLLAPENALDADVTKLAPLPDPKNAPVMATVIDPVMATVVEPSEKRKKRAYKKRPKAVIAQKKLFVEAFKRINPSALFDRAYRTHSTVLQLPDRNAELADAFLKTLVEGSPKDKQAVTASVNAGAAHNASQANRASVVKDLARDVPTELPRARAERGLVFEKPMPARAGRASLAQGIPFDV